MSIRLRNDNSGDTSLVFRPGGQAGGNVYTTWAPLMAATLVAVAQVSILIDDTIAPANAIAGTWNVDNVTFTAEGAGNGILHLPTGCFFAFSSLTLDNEVTISNDGTSNTWVDAPFAALYIKGGSTLQSTSTGRFSVPSNGHTFDLFGEQRSSIGDGVHAVFAPAAGASLGVSAIGGLMVNAHALAGAGSQFLFLTSDCTFGTNDGTGAITTNYLSNANQTKYTVGTGGNWNPVPLLTSPALDQLAAPNVQNAAANTGTGTATVTVTTGNITKAKNGKMVIASSCLFATSLGATITAQLKRDATNIGTAKTITLAALVSGLEISLDFIDTAPDNAAHTYQLSVSVSAGVLTVSAGGAQISVHEDS